MSRGLSSSILTSVLLLAVLSLAPAAEASHISGIRITQTGNTGLEINVDITAFYSTGSTVSQAYLGTYYNAVPAADWGDGSTVPRYGYGPSTGIPLVATSTVVNGIPARAYRGSFSHTYGAPGTYQISANTRCCPITTPTYTLVTGTIITTTVSTTGVFGPTTFTTSFVQNTLDVVAQAPLFSKAFAPNPAGIGAPSTLTYTVDGLANTLDADALDFTDNLPAGLEVAAVPNAANTCTGGTFTAVAGTSVISYTGGAVPAGATCTLSVDVTGVLPGSFPSTSGDLTSAFGNSGTAADTLVLTAVPLSFTKAFAPDTVGIGEPSTLTFTIGNNNAATVSMIDFTDTLPTDLLIATPSNAGTTCTGGTLTAAAGTGTISYSGGSVAGASICTVSVDVVSDLPGSYLNTTGDLTSTAGNSGSAGDSLDVTAVALGFTKAFDPMDIGLGGTSTLTFTVENTNDAEVTMIDVVDSLPAGTEVADPANVTNSCGGTLTAAVGATSVTLAGGTVAANATCTFSVDILGTASGAAVNTTGDLTSTAGNSGTATATLNVNEVPLFTKAFNPDSISIGEVATLTFTIDHSAGISPATDLAFVDNLPTGMEVADPPNPFDSCGGVLTANAGDGTITYTGGTVAATAVCQIGVDITITSPCDFTNVADDLTSNLGASAPGSAVAALAGGTLIDIPTMSTFGLAGLALLLSALAVFTIRRRS